MKKSCHGDASVFSFASVTCTGCVSFDSCVSSTHDSLLQLNLGAPAKPMLERHVRFVAYKKDKAMRGSVLTGKRALTDDEERIAKTLPSKVASQYRRIVSEGFVPRMKEGLAKGLNPFDRNGYKYLSVAFDALLAGGFTKRELRLNYMGSCGWSEGTAFSAVNMAWHLFSSCGVAGEFESSLQPIKNDNNIESQGKQ